MTKKTTGFDAFFDAVTSSGEFKSVVENDWGKDFEKAIKKMEKAVDKAGELPSKLQETFASPEAIEAGNSYSRKSENKTETKGEDKKPIDIITFENKNPETFGFAGVAGMDKLKQDLKENFIKPLKFKFLVEGMKISPQLKSKSPHPNPLPKGEGTGKREAGATSSPFGRGMRGGLGIEGEGTGKREAGVTSSPLGRGLRGGLGSNGDDGGKSFELDNKKIEAYKKIQEAYDKFNVSIPTGMLFYGPPGTGKTFLTKKLAQELGAGLIVKSVGEFGSSYIHSTSKNIREFFTGAKEASKSGPIILFLDEIDSLVSKRTNNVDANKAEEVSQFLQEFNALEEAPNLIVIAATNRPDHLDSALLRSGRLDKKIYIGPPDFEARKELFKIYIEKEKRPHSKLDYKKLAELTDGYVAADLEAICDEVARDASKNILDLASSLEGENVDYEQIANSLGENKITMELLVKAIEETKSSLKFVDMSVFENWEKL